MNHVSFFRFFFNSKQLTPDKTLENFKKFKIKKVVFDI